MRRIRGIEQKCREQKREKEDGVSSFKATRRRRGGASARGLKKPWKDLVVAKLRLCAREAYEKRELPRGCSAVARSLKLFSQGDSDVRRPSFNSTRATVFFPSISRPCRSNLVPEAVHSSQSATTKDLHDQFILSSPTSFFNRRGTPEQQRRRSFISPRSEGSFPFQHPGRNLPNG